MIADASPLPVAGRRESRLRLLSDGNRVLASAMLPFLESPIEMRLEKLVLDVIERGRIVAVEVDLGDRVFRTGLRTPWCSIQLDRYDVVAGDVVLLDLVLTEGVLP